MILCKGDSTEDFLTAFEEIDTGLMTTTTAEIRIAVTNLILQYRYSDEQAEENEFLEDIQQAIDRQKKNWTFCLHVRNFQVRLDRVAGTISPKDWITKMCSLMGSTTLRETY